MLSRAFPLAVLMTLVLAPSAVANHPAPPAGFSCVGGYNPGSYTNVCYDIGGTPSVGVDDRQACYYVIGYLPGCVDYVFPTTTVDTPRVFVQGPLCNGSNHYTPLWCQTVLA